MPIEGFCLKPTLCTLYLVYTDTIAPAVSTQSFIAVSLACVCVSKNNKDARHAANEIAVAPLKASKVFFLSAKISWIFYFGCVHKFNFLDARRKFIYTKKKLKQQHIYIVELYTFDKPHRLQCEKDWWPAPWRRKNRSRVRCRRRRRTRCVTARVDCKNTCTSFLCVWVGYVFGFNFCTRDAYSLTTWRSVYSKYIKTPPPRFFLVNSIQNTMNG